MFHYRLRSSSYLALFGLAATTLFGCADPPADGDATSAVDADAAAVGADVAPTTDVTADGTTDILDASGEPGTDAGAPADGTDAAGAEVAADAVVAADTAGTPVNCAATANGTACDDSNPCTTGTACTAGACGGGLNVCQCAGDADCAVLDDTNLCNGKLFCNKATFPFQCEVLGASVVVCAGSTSGVCGLQTCNPATGKCQTGASDGAPCNDDDPCTATSFCAAGQCKADGANTCQCATDSDCGKFEDANLCNGSFYCDKAAFPFSCKVNPATVVICDASGDSACSKNVCSAATGKCAATPAENAVWVCGAKGCAWQPKGPNDPTMVVVPCSDGQNCTTGDYCEAGTCKSGADSCSCASNADCLAQEDGNLCNGTLFCNKALKPAACQVNPATVVTCANGQDTACEKNACNISLGKCDCAPNAKPGTCTLSVVENTKQVCADGKCRYETLPFGASATEIPACDDGNGCTTGEVCQAGSCGGGTDTCVCASDFDCKSQEDGNACNGTLFCNKASKKCEINPASFVVCPTGLDTACVKNVCLPKTGQCGLANAASSVTCDDGDSCTVGDTCDNGNCKAGTNTCSCTSDIQCAKYEDGDGCNGTMFCNKGKSPAICEVNPATVVSCPSVDDTACLKNQCQPKTGKCQPTATADFTACDDGNKCTKADSCLFGKCQPGTVTCECATNADCAAKDDGDLCNGTFYCDKSGDPKCVFNPGSVVYCSKNNDSACLQAKCDAKTGGCGLAPLGDGVPCDDGTSCTDSDACKLGKCTGKAIDCDDNNPCTVDGCDASGCTHKAANCADGNDCTADQCDVKTGQCAFPAVVDGKSCNGDDDGCTVNDTCSAGKCKVGTAVVCKIALEACQVSACQSTGAKSFACVALPAKDGSVCSGTASCVLGFACQLGQCQPLPQDKLYVAGLGTFGKALALQAVHPIATGSVVGGRRLLGPDDQPTGSNLAVAELAGDASVVWQVEVASAGAYDDLAGVAAVQRLATGETAIIATRRFSATGDLDVWVAKLAAAGKSFVADKQVVQAGTDAVFGAAYNPQVGWWAAGQQGTGSLARAWLVRLSESGTVLASWKSSAAAADHLRAAVILPDGGALAVGDRLEGSIVRALLVRVDGQGAAIWQKTLGDNAPLALVSLVSAPSGLFAAGSKTTGGVDLPQLLQLDASGKVLASFTGTSAAAVHSVAVLTGGRAVLAGSVGAGANSQAWTQGFAPPTNQGGLEPIWSNTDLASIPAGWQAVAVAPDGGLWLIGGKSKSTAALVGRADPWGHLSCLTAGSCADKAPDACDDKEGCTYDLCEPGTGCVHAPSSSPCTDSDACTVGDVCQAGACLSGDVTTCDDGNPCTSDTCDIKSGCSHGFTTSTCTDNDACTTSDTCSGGTCAGKPTLCDDGSICTTDSCDSKKGCQTAVKPNACNDGNYCTADNCDLAKGCVFTNLTVPCNAGDPCSEGDVCSAGNCAAGSIAKYYGNTALASNKDLRAVYAVVPHDSGTLAMVGENFGQKDHGLFGLIAAGGTSAAVTVPEPDKDNHLVALTRIGSTAVVYAGNTTALGAAGVDGWLHRIDGNGTLQWSYPYGGLKNDRFDGVAALGDGCLAVGKVDGGDGWVVRVNADGVVIKQTKLGGAGDDGLVAIAPIGTGGYIAAGSTTSMGAGGSDGWLVRLDSSGDVVWQHSYGLAQDQAFTDVAATDDGGFVAGGPQVFGGLLAKTNGLGQALWYRDVNLGGAIALSPTPGGVVMAVSSYLRQYDNTGTTLWTTNLVASCAQLNDVVVLSDQTIVAGGGGTNTPYAACLVHTDRFGHPSCAAAGNCAGKTVQDCDDGNVCTDTVCDPATGCKGTPNTAPCTSGAACTIGDTCSNGACAPSKNPRLFDVAAGTIAQGANFVTTSRLGGYLVAGVKGPQYGYLARVTQSGGTQWQAENLYNKGTWFSSAAELADGRIAVVGGDGGEYSAPVLFVSDPNGNWLANGQIPSKVFEDKNYTSYAELDAVAALPDDTLAVAGRIYASMQGGQLVYAFAVVGLFNDQAKLQWAIWADDVGTCRGLTVLGNSDLSVWCGNSDSFKQKPGIVHLVVSKTGKVLSKQLFPTPAAVIGLGHTVDGAGNTYIAASAWSFPIGDSKGRILIFKFNATGNLLWQRLIDHPNSHFAAGMLMTGAGPVIAGYVFPSANDSGTYHGYLAGLDPFGNLAWQRTLGGAGYDRFSAGIADGNNMMLVGTTTSKGAAPYDQWLVRTDSWGYSTCPLSGPCVKLAASACTDSLPCTVDTCSPVDGGCQNAPTTCDDGNPCTTDACDPKLGCQWTQQADGTPACPNSGKCSLGYCP